MYCRIIPGDCRRDEASVMNEKGFIAEFFDGLQRMRDEQQGFALR
jgi:hypothetical protein